MTKIVKYTKSDGTTAIDRLVKENKLTAIVKPNRWIKSPEIKIHKQKQHMVFTGEVI